MLAVSHGSLIRKLIKIASQGELPLAEDRLENLSMNRLLHQDGNWSVSDYSVQSFAAVSASKDEGFGIPLVEAMARGIPVVVSNLEIFQEVAGPAGTYFNPDSPETPR